MSRIVDENPGFTSGDSPTLDASRHDDPRLLAAVEEYMAALESGGRPSRGEFLTRYADIAGELAACLDGLAFVHSAAGQIPGAPVLPRGADEHLGSIDLENAQPLGDFRLVREIGHGGMGVVYEAVQLSLGRRVAVKVLPLAAALDSRHLERFRNEAQAAAQLHHTNIVPVYAVGCERSVHFYAMQLINGQSLAEVIRELQSAAGALTGGGIAGAEKPPVGAPAAISNLTTLCAARGSAYAKSVAGLGLQVAEALDYAHRAGIVHRDIKPANLLLDQKGILWITDFGLAQFYTDNGLTRTGDMVGTMRYMSPEQASGRAVVLDQRTDIYSLGATLYELLTLTRAVPGSTHEELMRRLAQDDPRPARAVDKTIPREMEIILAKAMAKDPADRYLSARHLADDLRRFLQEEPIRARPPSAWDHGVKWIRRHKTLAASTVIILLLATAGLLVSTVLIAREQARTKAAYDLEYQKAIEAGQQRIRAEKASHQARDAVDFFSRIAIGMDRPEFSEVRREMLEESLSYYQSFLDDHESAGEADLGAARANVAAFLAYFGALDASMRGASKARLLAEPSVQRELKLTIAQATAAQAFSADIAPKPGESLADFYGLDPDVKRERFSQRAREIETALNYILTASQAERLRQVYLQTRGPLAFSEPEVVKALALTRDQKTAIRTLQSQYRVSRVGPGPRRDSPPPPGPRADPDARILALLTSAQLQAWKELTGIPFTAKISPRGMDLGQGNGRGGPGPDRGGPHGNGPGEDGKHGFEPPPEKP